MNIPVRRTLALNQCLAQRLDAAALATWTPRIPANLDRLRTGVRGHPHTENLTRWRHPVEVGDVEGVRALLLSTEEDKIQMREVSPMSGVFTEAERLAALNSLHRP